jgi:hypothetical protein
LGKVVAVLAVNDFKNTGSDKVTCDASMYSSGIYIYRIEAGDFAATKKMMLLK